MRSLLSELNNLFFNGDSVKKKIIDLDDETIRSLSYSTSSKQDAALSEVASSEEVLPKSSSNTFDEKKK